tara:strand:- start:6155 stop:6592 length:438 start_codon:yes stop_codon:yes gene_type:complete
MHPTRKRRLYVILLIVIGIAIAASLVLYALRQNIDLFYTPSQVAEGQAPTNHQFRLGGLVEKGSVKRRKQGLTIYFTLTDTAKTVRVKYIGILPDLFREGQGIVATGKLNRKGVFVASQILAKHDENYEPPDVKYALKMAKQHDS